MPVIVEVEPGCVIADVFVIVKVNVFVWELNSQTTTAVEAWPELTPEMVIVSARTLVLATANTNSAANEKTNLPKWDIDSLLVSAITPGPPYPHFGRKGGEFCGATANLTLWLCDRILGASSTWGQSIDPAVTKFQQP